MVAAFTAFRKSHASKSLQTRDGLNKREIADASDLAAEVRRLRETAADLLESRKRSVR